MADGQGMSFQQQVALNDSIRQIVIKQAMPMKQPLPPQTITGTVTTSNNVLVFQPRLVGLLTGLLVEVNATVNNAGAATANRTQFGASNVVTNFQFTDLNNYLRHNTTGYHVALLNSCRVGSWYGGAIDPNLPFNVGNKNTVNSLAATIATGATPALRQFYYIPIAYDAQRDLRGAIFSQVINAAMNLQITINPSPGEAAGDPLNKVYNGATAAGNITLSNVTVTVTQCYYDQLPRDPNTKDYLLPFFDLSTNYMLNQTTWNNLTASQDNTFPFANYRTFLSTMCVYDNAGTFNTGSDITYWQIKYANSLLQWQKNPETVFLDVRNQIGFDLPNGVYYHDHRDFPIATANYGNCDLVVMPSSVTAGAFISVCYEQFAQGNAIRNATSLPNG